MADIPYSTYSRYLKRTHGCRVWRVAVDGGFTCPNRSSSGLPASSPGLPPSLARPGLGLPASSPGLPPSLARPGLGLPALGCTFCGEEGSRAPYLGDTEELKEQVLRAVTFLSTRYQARAFILYFQAFSATNAPLETLRHRYDEGLSLADFRGLVISTRPDCVDTEKAALIAGYRRRGLDVWVELGLQSANEATLRRIERGHDLSAFLAAYALLKEAGVKIAVHLILGLPGETRLDIERTAELVADLGPDGIKIHNLHIPAGTVMAEELLKGEITAPGPASHLEAAIAVLERLPPSTVVMRLTTDTRADKLLAPRGFPDKQGFASLLTREMMRRGSRQGARFGAG